MPETDLKLLDSQRLPHMMFMACSIGSGNVAVLAVLLILHAFCHFRVDDSLIAYFEWLKGIFG